MSYRVVFQPGVLTSLERQYQYLAAKNPAAAVRWFNGFVEALEGLAEFPQRCPIAPESAKVRQEVRQLLYGKRKGIWRAYFSIEQDSVRVLRPAFCPGGYLT
jgi:plasmid stabilization system protein ParE